MSREDRKDSTIRIDLDNKEALRKICKRTGFSQPDVLNILFNIAESENLITDGWQKRLKALERKADREIEALYYWEDPERCPAIAKGSEKYKCVWGRVGRPPEIRVLEADYQSSKEVCMKCKITLMMKEEVHALRNQADNLEKRLKEKVNVKYKVPICNKGAILNEDATEFSGCPKHRGENVSVATFCKVYSSGLPCALYAERVIGVADGESELGSGKNA